MATTSSAWSMVAPTSGKVSRHSSTKLRQCGVANEDSNDKELGRSHRDCDVTGCCSGTGAAVGQWAPGGAGLFADRRCEAEWPACTLVVGRSGNFCADAEHPGAAQCAVALRRDWCRAGLARCKWCNDN